VEKGDGKRGFGVGGGVVLNKEDGVKAGLFDDG